MTKLSWLDAIPGDTPVFVIAEGLMMYLHEKDGTALLRRITEQFPSGQLAFDGYSGAMTRLVSRLATVRGAKVELIWGVDDPHDLEKQVPRLRLVEDVPFLTMPALVDRLARGGVSRAMHGMMGRLPFYRHLVRHLRYEF
ncbi:hypothetical protein [Archangium lansingense]|uniref:Leucine carboxyl methyltransferase n=1 Tax=Archangium lansingense TaxID=2995310 RepID=A0ABT4A3T5_9BACT|nr:hypothetical protein [Archangium lansinium]MCY1076310.1 hypothetical protein [Archangium lansinium]